MKNVLFVAIFIASLICIGCSGNNAEAIYETAKLEELQDNREHAIKLYRDIIQQYPEHPLAEKARSRLAELEP